MIYQQSSINNSYIKVRWQEPYTSASLNSKTFGVLSPGVYEGFTIQPGSLSNRDLLIGSGFISSNIGLGNNTGYQQGNYDATVGYSIAVYQDPSGFQTTLQLPPSSSLHLNATGLEGNRVYIILNVQFSIQSQTLAQAMLVDSTYIDQNPWVIVLGYVDVPSSTQTPLDASMLGYFDPIYPRTSPASTPEKAGLMPAYAWGLIGQNTSPWQSLLVLDVTSNNPYVLSLTPSQGLSNGRKIYTYIQPNVASKFPRNADGDFNGGVNGDQLTYLNVQTGVIGGAHQVPTNVNFSIGSVSGTPNSYQLGLIGIDSQDRIVVNYGGIYNSVSGATLDDHIPTLNSGVLEVGGFVLSTDSSGNLLPLSYSPEAILWRRPFLSAQGISSASPNFVTEAPTTTDGINFQLSQIPLSSSSIFVEIDGLISTISNDWVLTGPQFQTLQFVNGNEPKPGQTLEVTYVAQGTSSLTIAQEIPSGMIDGNNLKFNLSGSPANLASIFLWVDREKVFQSDFSLIQSESGSSIVFNPGSQPKPGQDIYIGYFINLAVTGIAPSSSPSPSQVTPVVMYYTLTQQDVDQEMITLNSSPSNPETVLLDVVGDTAQIYGVDFIINDNQLSWSHLGLAGELNEGNVLRIYYLV